MCDLMDISGGQVQAVVSLLCPSLMNQLRCCPGAWAVEGQGYSSFATPLLWYQLCSLACKRGESMGF